MLTQWLTQIASGFAMERFMVYSHLSRVGYIVFRWNFACAAC